MKVLGIIFLVMFSASHAFGDSAAVKMWDWLEATEASENRTSSDVKGFVEALNDSTTDCQVSIEGKNRVTVSAIDQYTIDPWERLSVHTISMEDHSYLSGYNADGERQFLMYMPLGGRSREEANYGNRPINISIEADGAGFLIGEFIPDPTGTFGFECKTIED